MAPPFESSFIYFLFVIFYSFCARRVVDSSFSLRFVSVDSKARKRIAFLCAGINPSVAIIYSLCWHWYHAFCAHHIGVHNIVCLCRVCVCNAGRWVRWHWARGKKVKTVGWVDHLNQPTNFFSARHVTLFNRLLRNFHSKKITCSKCRPFLDPSQDPQPPPPSKSLKRLRPACANRSLWKPSGTKWRGYWTRASSTWLRPTTPAAQWCCPFSSLSCSSWWPCIKGGKESDPE